MNYYNLWQKNLLAIKLSLNYKQHSKTQGFGRYNSTGKGHVSF